MGTNSYSFLSYKSAVWIIVFLMMLLIFTIILYLNFPSGFNQGIYHYQGLVLKNGGLPYIDFVEKKGPMGLLTYSLASLFFGETIMAYRFFDLIILSLTAFSLFRLSRLNHSKIISFLIGVVWLRHVIIDGPGNTGDVTNIITLCYVFLSYHLLKTKKTGYFLIAGITIAIACWVKPTALLIGLPLILFFYFKKVKSINTIEWHYVLEFLLGMLIPSIIFLIYLLLTKTFYGFWESVVLDTLFNYSGYVSRFSTRTLFKTFWTFLNDPILRFGGILSLFVFSKNLVIKLIVIGVGLMLFVEGRFYPYQYSILWPFLTLGFVEGIIILIKKLSKKKASVLIILCSIIIVFPIFKTGTVFIRSGFLTNNFDAGQTFLLPDFKEMYYQRKAVVSYLEHKISVDDEIFVLGQDPNIYLELGVITTCRLAREGFILTGELTNSTPKHLISWQEELLEYMEDQKADRVIVLKKLTGLWIDVYSHRINSILYDNYQFEHETEGHLIFKRK
ncbi:hypothetical protein C7H52_04805 [Aurantibacter aestuarii]|uniref:Glycosyltransferase RgtA/B/C/D-like domain-containing protein n=2 Tax=Aurantibacter aestuarii TaxID=1266046 RepID=A0A2T1NE01_9FLAO|nr:hypothetical protein C7H52_04805 [Aurantibacter aestuarii]